MHTESKDKSSMSKGMSQLANAGSIEEHIEAATKSLLNLPLDDGTESEAYMKAYDLAEKWKRYWEIPVAQAYSHWKELVTRRDSLLKPLEEFMKKCKWTWLLRMQSLSQESSPKVLALKAQSAFTTRKKISFIVKDEALVPRELCSPDKKKIEEQLKKLNGIEASIPGIEIFEEEVVVLKQFQKGGNYA